MMICYRDQTFCASDCANSFCYRFLSEEMRVAAQKADLPVAMSDFSENCDDYIPGTPQ